MATPIIRSVAHAVIKEGEGRNDLVTSELVTLSDANVANAGKDHLWELLDIPVGSSSFLSSSSGETTTFTPDIVGSYHVRCTVESVAYDTEVLAVPLPTTGARIPAFDERLEYDASGNTRGWHQAISEFMRNADTSLVKAKVDSADTSANYLENKVIAGTDITVTKSITVPKTLTVDLKAVSPDPQGTYNSPSQIIVDSKGRVTSVTEGASGDYRVVADLDELGDLDVTGMTNGTQVFVTSLMDTYALSTGSVAPEDDTNYLVRDTSSTGKWLRQCVPNKLWATQGDWYVDPTSGDNENPGDVSSPLKTFSELDRRLHGVAFEQPVGIMVLSSNTDDSDPLKITFSTSECMILGTKVETTTGTISGYTHWNPNAPSGGQDARIVDSSRDWSSLVGSYVEFYDGATYKYSSWIAKDLGSHTARITCIGSGSPIDLTGYTYKIYTLPTITGLSVLAPISSTSSMVAEGLYALFLNICDSSDKANLSVSVDSVCELECCRLGGYASYEPQQHHRPVRFNNCQFAMGAYITDPNVAKGLFYGGAYFAGSISVDVFPLFQAAPVMLSCPTREGRCDLCIFDAPAGNPFLTIYLPTDIDLLSVFGKNPDADGVAMEGLGGRIGFNPWNWDVGDVYMGWGDTWIPKEYLGYTDWWNGGGTLVRGSVSWAQTVQGQSNTADTIMEPFRVVRQTATGVTYAQADSPANVANVCGVSQSRVKTAGEPVMVNSTGSVLVLCTGTPAVPGIAYVSPSEAGKATTTAPASNKLRLGQVTAAYGNYAVVALDIDVAVVEGGGHTIQEDGTALTQREGLNFATGLTATDDVGNNRTNVNLATLDPSPIGTYTNPSSVTVDATGRVTAASSGSTPTDEKLKVSSDDTTAGYLEGKLLAGQNVVLSTQNPAGNETRTINVSSSGVLRTRVAPDSSDRVVLTFDEAAGSTSFANSGSLGGAAWAGQDTAYLRAGLTGVDPVNNAFGNAVAIHWDTANNRSGGWIKSADGFFEPSVFTISCWVRLPWHPQGATWPIIIAKGANIGAWDPAPQVAIRALGLSGSNVLYSELLATDDTLISCNSSLQAVTVGEWVFLAVSYDGTNLKQYVNGKLSASTSSAKTLDYQNSGPWFIGQPYDLADKAEFSIDDVRMANVVRTADYLLDMYQKGSGQYGQSYLSTVNRRVPADSNDLCVLTLDEAFGSTTFINTGSEAGNFTADGTVIADSPGILGSSAKIVRATNSRIRSAAAKFQPSSAITCSFWAFLEEYTGGGAAYARLLSKQQDTGSWVNGDAIGVCTFVTASSSVAFVFNTSVTGRVAHSVSWNIIPLYEWVHIALTYDGSNVKWYVNGKLIMDYAYTGTIVYGATPGLWFMGAAETQTGENSNFRIDDVRIANVARSASYILDMYQRGAAKYDTALNEKVKVSSGDTTSNYLLDKLSAGSGVTLTKQNAGANETVQISGGFALTNMYEVDFTSLPTASITNGANTIDGKTWTAENAGNASSFQVLNGTGIRIANNATNSVLYETTRTAPLVTVPIASQLAASATLLNMIEMRVWFMFSTNSDANYEATQMGIETNPIASQFTRLTVAKDYFTSGNRLATTLTEDGVRNGDSTASTDLTHDVYMIRMLNQAFFEIWTGTSVAGAFPAASTLTLRHWARSKTASYAWPPRLVGREWGIVLASTPSNTSGNLVSVFKRLKIEGLLYG